MGEVSTASREDQNAMFFVGSIAGTSLSMAALAASLLVPVASVEADRCDELRKKVSRGAGLTNAEQN